MLILKLLWFSCSYWNILLTNNLNITKLTIWDVPIYFILPLPLVLNRMTYCNLKTHCEKLICNHALDKTIRCCVLQVLWMQVWLKTDDSWVPGDCQSQCWRRTEGWVSPPCFSGRQSVYSQGKRWVGIWRDFKYVN